MLEVSVQRLYVVLTQLLVTSRIHSTRFPVYFLCRIKLPVEIVCDAWCRNNQVEFNKKFDFSFTRVNVQSSSSHSRSFSTCSAVRARGLAPPLFDGTISPERIQEYAVLYFTPRVFARAGQSSPLFEHSTMSSRSLWDVLAYSFRTKSSFSSISSRQIGHVALAPATIGATHSVCTRWRQGSRRT